MVPGAAAVDRPAAAHRLPAALAVGGAWHAVVDLWHRSPPVDASRRPARGHGAAVRPAVHVPDEARPDRSAAVLLDDAVDIRLPAPPAARTGFRLVVRRLLRRRTWRDHQRRWCTDAAGAAAGRVRGMARLAGTAFPPQRSACRRTVAAVARDHAVAGSDAALGARRQ